MAAHEHAHENDHPYHLVDPSPYPIMTSFSLLFVVLAGLSWMKGYEYGAVLTLATTAWLISNTWRWWRSTIKEGLVDKAHTPAVQTGLRFGMALFIASEVMFFFAFFWAFFNASLFPLVHMEDTWDMLTKTAVWPPEGIQTFNAWDLPFLNTLVLLLSGTTVTWAHHALLHGNMKDVTRGLALTVLLGFSFTCLQALEYSHATFGLKDGIYGSVFYLATGFHGAHVLIGTIFLAVCLVRSMRGTLTKKGHLGFEFAAWYWHFVDAVWLFLFAFVYWWGA
jgi:cytochrome c oxidase subunit III